jgi:hypothetical protein
MTTTPTDDPTVLATPLSETEVLETELAPAMAYSDEAADLSDRYSCPHASRAAFVIFAAALSRWPRSSC